MDENSRRTIDVALTVDLQKSDSGLWFVTSPLVRGLFTTGKTEEEAVEHAMKAIAELDSVVSEIVTSLAVACNKCGNRWNEPLQSPQPLADAWRRMRQIRCGNCGATAADIIPDAAGKAATAEEA